MDQSLLTVAEQEIQGVSEILLSTGVLRNSSSQFLGQTEEGVTITIRNSGNRLHASLPAALVSLQ